MLFCKAENSLKDIMKLNMYTLHAVRELIKFQIRSFNTTIEALMTKVNNVYFPNSVKSYNMNCRYKELNYIIKII